jgi:hypothetical protein
MDINYIKEVIEKAFSKTGFQISGFSVFLPKIISIKVEKKMGGLSIAFNEDLPNVTVKKFFIPINVQIQGIVFGENEGSIRLKYFPDINFNYQNGISSEMNFGSVNEFDTSDFTQEINHHFKDKERRKIAQLALKYTKEWASIVSENGVNFSQCNQNRKDQLYKDCNSFVNESIIQSKEIEAKSAILTFILIYLVLPAVISWVVKKFLDRMFK